MHGKGVPFVELASNGEPLDRRRGLMRVLIGPQAVGKTTLCQAAGNRAGTVLSLDRARGLYGAGPHDQDATPAAVEHVRRAADAMLAMNAAVTIDATSTTRRERATWLDLAREHKAPAIAVILWVPLAEILRRNAAREEPVPEPEVRLYWHRVTVLSADALIITERFHRVQARISPNAAARELAARDAVPPSVLQRSPRERNEEPATRDGLPGNAVPAARHAAFGTTAPTKS